MSAMEKIFGMFRATATPTQAPAVGNNMQGTPTQQTQQTAQTDSNGVIPTQPAPAPAPASPLAKFEKVWQPNEKNGEEEPAPLSADPKKIMEAAAKVDFTKILSQEALAKVQAGGEEAVQAMAALLNQTAQAVYGQSTVAASKIVEQALQQAEQKFAAQVPGLVNRKAAEAKLLSANKALADPAVAPIVSLIQTQLANKFPQATSDELAEMAKEMMQGAANVFAPPSSNNNKPAEATVQEDDWTDYLK